MAGPQSQRAEWMDPAAGGSTKEGNWGINTLTSSSSSLLLAPPLAKLKSQMVRKPIAACVDVSVQEAGWTGWREDLQGPTEEASMTTHLI